VVLVIIVLFIDGGKNVSGCGEEELAGLGRDSEEKGGSSLDVRVLSAQMEIPRAIESLSDPDGGFKSDRKLVDLVKGWQR
jgi:hypothetical protein